MAVIAIVAVLVLLRVVAITVAVTIPLQQQPEAARCESRFLYGGGFLAFNASPRMLLRSLEKNRKQKNR